MVKAAKEFIEEPDKVLGGALGGEVGEADNVGEEYADVLVPLDIDLVELPLDGGHDVGLHLHGHVLRQHGQQQPLLVENVVIIVEIGGEIIAWRTRRYVC